MKDGLIFVICIISLAIDVVVAVYMGILYEDKGGSGSKGAIIALCFFLPFIGYFYVAAMPSYRVLLKIDELEEKVQNGQKHLLNEIDLLKKPQ